MTRHLTVGLVVAALVVGCSDPTTPPLDAARLSGTWRWEVSGPAGATDGGDAATLVLSVQGSTVNALCLEYAFLVDDTLTGSGAITGNTLSLDCAGSLRGIGPVVMHVEANLLLERVLVANSSIAGGAPTRRIFRKVN